MRAFKAALVGALLTIPDLSLSNCFDTLVERFNSNNVSDRVREVMVKYDVSDLSVAMASRESGFNPSLTSKAGAVGLYQITKVALKDAVAECGDLVYAPKNLKNPEYNYLVHRCFVKRIKRAYLEDDEGDMEILTYYNGGLRQLNRLRKGLTIDRETSGFVVNVLHKMEICRRDASPAQLQGPQ